MPGKYPVKMDFYNCDTFKSTKIFLVQRWRACAAFHMTLVT